MRLMPLAVFLLLCASAAAPDSLPARQVLGLAPELEAFAGSRSNLESLASGLRAGTEVRLISLTPDGMREVVTFTAAGALPALETVQVLQNARYHLLERGIAAPSGWDIALVLMGSVDIRPEGPVRRPGLLTPADPTHAMVLSLHPFAGSQENYRNLMRGLTQARQVTLVDAVERRTRVRFTPGCALPQNEARSLLLAAAERLAARHIGDPLIEEVAGAVLELLEAKCSAG